MSISIYLKSLFAVTPNALRDVLSYIPSWDPSSFVEGMKKNSACPCCEHGTRSQVRDEKGGFRITCTCGAVLKDSQPSALLAWCAWVEQKQYPLTLHWGNPWIDEDYWKTRLRKCQENRDMNPLMKILAGLRLHQKLWSAQKNMPIFKSLSTVDSDILMSIGFFNRIFRKEVILGIKSFFPEFDFVRAEKHLDNLYIKAVQERLSVWSKIQSDVPVDLRSVWWETLRSELEKSAEPSCILRAS